VKKLAVNVVLLIIVSSLSELACVATPPYSRQSLLRKEQELRQNLDTLRKTIDAYTYDKRKAPQSFEDLIRAGYLKKIPIDPMTNKSDWKIVMTEHGINDVKSSSQSMSTEGTAYNTW
jgi:general secretion pathway protein G